MIRKIKALDISENKSENITYGKVQTILLMFGCLIGDNKHCLYSFE